MLPIREVILAQILPLALNLSLTKPLIILFVVSEEDSIEFWTCLVALRSRLESLLESPLDWKHLRHLTHHALVVLLFLLTRCSKKRIFLLVWSPRWKMVYFGDAWVTSRSHGCVHRLLMRYQLLTLFHPQRWHLVGINNLKGLNMSTTWIHGHVNLLFARTRAAATWSILTRTLISVVFTVTDVVVLRTLHWSTHWRTTLKEGVAFIWTIS